MVKLKSDPISSNDMNEYLEGYSDFSFELSILKMAREEGLECEHGGLYEDPVTKKYREFDIRAIRTIGDYRIRLAIECKNIRKNFPILASCVPRDESESYHQIVLVAEPKMEYPDMTSILYKSRARSIYFKGHNSIYKSGSMVCKNIVQIGRKAGQGSEIVSSDSELFEKWSQSLNSIHDLVSRIYGDGDSGKDALYLSLAFPIVVVPDGRLWQVQYDDDGSLVSNPTIVDRVSSFVDKSYRMGSTLAGDWMRISHLEIMTKSGFREFIRTYLQSVEGARGFGTLRP